MRLAHVSDLHIGAYEGVPLRRFLNKRLSGLANLATFRRHGHDLDLLDRLVADLLEESLDHVVVTGDLSNLALETEFQVVFDRLKLLGGYRKVSTIPGNHDAYTKGAVRARRFESAFYPFMFPQFSDLDMDLYPYVKILDEVAIVGVNSAIASAPLLAWGKVGSRQLGRLNEALARDVVRERFVVVLVHHHLHEREPPEEWTAGFLDARAFKNVLREHRVDLVLHGHDHVAHQGAIRAGVQTIPVYGAGSATCGDPDPCRIARYNVYTIEAGQLRNVETKIYDARKRKFIWRF